MNKPFNYYHCHICNRDRDPQFIDIISHDVSIEHGFEYKGFIIRNIKYCNDNNECFERAKIKEYFRR